MNLHVRPMAAAAMAMVLLAAGWWQASPAYPSGTPNLANPGVYAHLSTAQKAALARNGFAVGPFISSGRSYTQFYDLYKDNLAAGVPSFITSDALLHMFHIMYDKTLVAMERELLAPRLQKMTTALIATTQFQLGATQNADIQLAARDNLAYLSVAARLLNPSAAVPASVAPVVSKELALIAAHQGFARSPLFGTQIDYSQFVPRGHYSDNVTLQRYFRAMTWYGRVNFLLTGYAAPLYTREALLLTRALGVPATHTLWLSIFDPATEWVGLSDDLSPLDYARVAAQIYPPNSPVSVVGDQSRLARFIALATGLPNPRISGDPIPSSADIASTKGMRLFPQRFIPDGAIMQDLIWDKVGTRANPRTWPLGLDVAAALGSSRAQIISEANLRQTAYAHYAARLSTAERYYRALPARAWNQNLYWRWLDTLRQVWAGAPAKAPSFMHNAAWQTRTVGTGLGSWAELRHDTLLYAKQPYGLGAGGGPPPFRVPYVEPVPAVWSHLLALVQAFKGVLTSEGLLSGLTTPIEKLDATSTRYLYPVPPAGDTGYRAAIDSYAGLVTLLQKAANSELAGKPVARNDALTLEKIGLEMEELDNFFQDNGAGKVLLPEQKQVAVIADVFTDPGSAQVLEEGVGDVLPAYAIVTIGGKQWLAEGGMFSYYEFHQPQSNRLTDDAWRAMKHRPAQPSWTSAYILK